MLISSELHETIWLQNCKSIPRAVPPVAATVDESSSSGSEVVQTEQTLRVCTLAYDMFFACVHG